MDIEKQFKKAILFKRVGFLIFLVAAIPSAFIENRILAYFLGIVFVIVAIIFERNYKCPNCGYVFDPRVRSSQLKYCNNCNVKLQ